MYIVYTCYTCLVIHWSMQFIREYLVNVPIQYIILHKGWHLVVIITTSFLLALVFVEIVQKQEIRHLLTSIAYFRNMIQQQLCIFYQTKYVMQLFNYNSDKLDKNELYFDYSYSITLSIISLVVFPLFQRKGQLFYMNFNMYGICQYFSFF